MNTETDGGVTEQIDQILVALSDRHRRYALYYLVDHPITDLETVIRTVIRHGTDHPPSQEETVQLTIEFQHRHLPKLEETGVIEYDKRTTTLRYHRSPVFTALLQVLRRIES